MKIILITVLSINLFAQTTITKDGTKTDPVKTLASILDAKEQSELKETFVKGADTDEETAIRMLTLDLAPFVKTLDRDIVTYNYREKEVVKLHKAWLTDTDSKDGIKYAKEWASAIKKHTPNETGYIGWGLYSSNNARSSASYANSDKDFALVTVKYPAQSKMLDIRKYGDEIPLSSSTINYLNKLCGYISTRSGYQSPDGYFSVDKKRLVKNKKCNDAFVKTLSKLGISGLIYKWDKDLPAKCDNSSKSAFVSFDLKVEEQNIDTFTNLPVSDLSNITKDQRVFKRMLLDRAKANGMDWFTDEDFKKYEKMSVNINLYSYHQFKDSFRSFEPSSDEVKRNYEKEILKETFGCDKKYAKQDAPHYDPNQALKYIVTEGFSGLDINKDLEGKIKSCQF